MDFLRYGADAKKAFDYQEEQRNNEVWRFYLNKGQTARIYFLDGVYDTECEMFTDLPQFFQHSFIGRTPLKFSTPCLVGTEYDVCPLCEIGSSRQPVMASTVIHLDHITTGGDKKQVRKIFVMHKTLLDSLSLGAKKRGGCKGWLVDVVRSKGQKSTYTFDFDKEIILRDINAKLSDDVITEALDYATNIKILSPEEMYKAGLVTPPVGQQNDESEDDDTGNFKIEW